MVNKLQKNILVFLSALILFSIILPFSTANSLQISPVNRANLSANFVTVWSFINITDGIMDPTAAQSNWTWNSTGSQVLVTKSGFSCNATDCTATLAISSMGEGVGVLKFNVGNSTASNLTVAVGNSFRIDKTNPSVSITSAVPAILEKNSIPITWLAADSGSGLSSTTVTITTPDSTKCPTLTYTSPSTTQILTAAEVQCPGTYTGSISSTDYSGLTSTASNTFKVNHVYTTTQTPAVSGNQNVVAVKSGIQNFFARIIAFFKNLFH